MAHLPAPESPPERLLTVQEVAECLRMHRESVRRWLRDGRLKGGRIGGRRLGYRIPESEVQRLISDWVGSGRPDSSDRA